MLTHPILAEAEAHDRRVLDEHEGRLMVRRIIDKVRREQAIADQQEVDENGVPFVIGAKVESFRELWYMNEKQQQRMMVAGWTGVLEKLDINFAWIQFEGFPRLYPIRRDYLRRTVRVVK